MNLLDIFLVLGVLYFLSQSMFNLLLIYEWGKKRAGEKHLIEALSRGAVVMYQKPNNPKMDA